MKLILYVIPGNRRKSTLLTKSIMHIELIVFDLAGTTVEDNRDVHRVLQHTLSKHDVIVSLEDANDVMGIPKPVAIRTLLEKRYDGTEPITTSWIKEIHQQFVDEMVWFYKTSPSVREKRGVSDTFLKLKENGIKIAVETGFDRRITNEILRRMRWAENGLIDCSVASDEVLRGRPFPDLIFQAMKETRVMASENVTKVGDTASDIQEGKAADCGMTIAITSGAFSSEALKRENPTALIDAIPDLLPLVL
ncbi:MAG TPA: HAD hydrolase-like protein [Ohtaekwangia sp.]|nr:HAD hydrolase-like protein [Ohtaekwangia sp.]